MIRLRAHALALCALVFLPALAPAATISVTTPFDLDVDNDNLCSLREAVNAAFVASRLSRREGASTSIKTKREELEDALSELNESAEFDPENAVYSRNELDDYLEVVVDEVADYDPEYWVGKTGLSATLQTRLVAYQQVILAINSNNGPHDFCTMDNSTTPATKVCAFPEGVELKPGYYTYRDLDNSDLDTSVTPPVPRDVQVVDPTNPAVTLTFSPDRNPSDSADTADRAYWNGAVWVKYTAAEPIPNSVSRLQLRQAIDFFKEVEDATNAEVERLSAIAEADGCDDGSSFDTVLLEEDTTYYLNSQIVLPIRLTLVGGGESTIIERCVSGACVTPATPSSQHRLFKVPNGMMAEFKRIVFRNGDAGSENGGAIIADTVVNMSDVWFESNRAASGGAIYSENSGSFDITRGVFTDNVATTGAGGALSQAGVSVVLTDSIFGGYVDVAGGGTRLAGNSAGTAGGAIAVLSPVSGSLKITGNAFVGNQADNGSALFLAGAKTYLTVENTTFARNRADVMATVDISLPPAAEGTFAFNNITMLENTALGGVAGLYVNRLLPVQLHNSIIAGNQGFGLRQDCDFAAGVIDARRNFRRNFYRPSAGAAGADVCPGVRHDPANSSDQPEVENFEPDPSFVLFRDPASPAQEALLNPMDPDVGLFYVPVYPNDVNDRTEIRLVNRGAAVQDEFRCSAGDQRGFERSSPVDEECDIGAVEYQIGRRSDDRVDMLVDERRCINIIADDLGDAEYVPGSLRVLNVERAGFNVYVVSREPGDIDNHSGIHATLDLDDPDVCANQSELLPYREAIVVVPAPGFRGETNVTYGLDWRTSGTVPVEGSVTAVAHVRTESAGGITSSTLGSLPIAALLAMALLALRRSSRLLAIVVAGMFGGVVHAEDNVIYVNSSLDEPLATTPGDGRCTLREALATARNDRANLSGGDCNNGNEGPDVIEFVPGLTEVVLEDSLIAYGGVTLRCPLPPEPAAGEEREEPQTCTIRRRAFELDPNGAPTAIANPKSFRLIDSRGSLIISRMTLEGGQAADRGAGQDGGAVFTVGNLTIFDSVFRNNSALSGGAIFLAGTNSALSISQSVFIGNSSRAYTEFDALGNVIGMTPTRQALCPLLARGNSLPGQVGTEAGGGGAIASSQSDAHRITILSSSFIANCAAYGAAAVDLNSRQSVVIANSTFSGNVSFHGAGAIDVSGALGNAILRNVTVIGNRSGRARHTENWEEASPQPQRRALQFGGARVDMTSSIVSNNVTESDVSIAANCSAFASGGMRRFNVYGDEDDNPAAGILPTPGRGHSCQIEYQSSDRLLYANEIFDAGNPDSGMLTPLLANKVGDTVLYLHEINANPAARGVLIDGGYTEGPAEMSQVDSGFNQTAKCATVDARGAKRASGERCDVGAFEVLGVTATNDMGNNVGRRDRSVVVDLIANDLYDDISALPGRAIKDDCDTTTPLQGAEVIVQTEIRNGDTVIRPEVRMRDMVFRFSRTRIDGGGIPRTDLCAEVTVPAIEYFKHPSVAKGVKFLRKGVPADDVLIGREPASNYVMQFENDDALRDDDVDLNGRVTLRYRVFTVDQTPSNEAEISIGIDNVPPDADDDLITVGVGMPASINVLANDHDDDASSASGLKIKSVSGTGCTPRYATVEDEDAEIVDHWRCQFGTLRLTGNGIMTFTPTNSFNPFSQDVFYEVSDQDPVREKTAKASVRFLVGRPVANAGSILGQDDLSDVSGFDFLGAAGTAFFLPLMLALFRRRTLH